MNIEMVLVTPEKAEALLEFNTTNRGLRVAHVNMLANDMSSGFWKMNGDAIRIAKDGSILDGQHRLHAVVRSGTSQQMLIITGLDVDTRVTMDSGAARTFGDTLKWMAVPNHNVVAAITTRVLLSERIKPFAYRSTTGSHAKPSKQELLAVLDTNPDIVDAGQKAVDLRRRTPLSGGTCGFAWLYLNRLDEEDCEDFFTKLASGANLAERDPILVLRSALTERRLTDVESVAMTFKSWNAYREGREVGLLRFKQGGKAPESFPVPK